MISRFLPLPVRRLLRIKVISRPPVYTLIDQPGQLPALLAALDRVDEVSLDTVRGFLKDSLAAGFSI